MAAVILPFRPKGQPVITTLKHALLVAGIIAGVMLLDNMTGKKLSTALAA